MRAAARGNKNIRGGKKRPAVVKPPVKKAVAGKAVIRKPVKTPRTVIDPAWKLSLPSSHFLQLPKTLSPRITELARSITRNVHTPYEKAVALRDFLRNNYKYKLYASPVPSGKESVEYFLFELKEGHCEYFAAALTVLARSAGLPARVATGFSPGNYNALTRQIEVYEYHAHAWTQIFIANTGWLTFDAVPPGEIISETTPAGIGRFRDPFGEEWRVTPPELTGHTLQYVQKKFQEEAAQREADRLKWEELRQRQKKTQLDAAKKPVRNKNLKKKTVKAGQVKPSGTKDRIREFIERHKAKIREKFLRHLAVPEVRNALLVSLTGGIVILLAFRRTLNLLKHLFYRSRSKRMMNRARHIRERDPARSILCLYRAVRLLLILAGMERKKNAELISYAAEVRRNYSALLWKRQAADPSVCAEKGEVLERDLRLIFDLFYALEYGSCPCSAADAAKCARAAAEIHAALKELLPNSLLP